MSENYVTTDGYRPLVLPAKGEDLLEGRQYVLTPLARLILVEEYGLHGVPTVVECIHRKVAATRLTIINENLETGERTERATELPAQAASFRSFLALRRILRFELDIAKLDSLAPFYDKSHKLPAMEEEWFHSIKTSNVKFRGCSLRWWSKNENSPVTTHSSKVRLMSIDLSILD